MPRFPGALVAGLILALWGIAGCAGPGKVRATGPGWGYLTRSPSLVRTLREDVRAIPILTAGDTLFSSEPGKLPFIFPGRATGLAVRDRGDQTAEVYVAHQDGWLEGYQGALVSRLVLDARNAGVLTGDYPVRPDRGYNSFAHAALVDSRVGFLRPEVFLNERGHRTRAPMVAAIDVFGERPEELPWLGAMRHKSTIALPAVAGKTVIVMTGGSTARSLDQLYLYVATSDTDVLTGSGQLYVLRADPRAVPLESRSAARIRRGFPVGGSFVVVDAQSARSAPALENLVQDLGCLNFIRLEGIALDRERPNAFYFTDRLGYAAAPVLQPTAGGGRLYHVVLDAIDPTRVEKIEVILDASEGDDLFRPSAIATDEDCVMIQEYPGSHGVHPSRILRYDLHDRTLTPLLECAERDTRNRTKPHGVGGEWETSGITNVSEIWGEDSWLFTVQAHTVDVMQTSGRLGEAGQLLLLRGPRSPRQPAPVGGSRP